MEATRIVKRFSIVVYLRWTGFNSAVCCGLFLCENGEGGFAVLIIYVYNFEGKKAPVSSCIL
jgi:hypothetical protein